MKPRPYIRGAISTISTIIETESVRPSVRSIRVTLSYGGNTSAEREAHGPKARIRMPRGPKAAHGPKVESVRPFRTGIHLVCITIEKIVCNVCRCAVSARDALIRKKYEREARVRVVEREARGKRNLV